MDLDDYLPTEATSEASEKFQQVGGDFGSAWDYGGMWYRASTGDFAAIDGLDANGIGYPDPHPSEAQKAELKAEAIEEAGDPADYLDQEDYERAVEELYDQNVDEWTNDAYEREEAAQAQPVYRFNFAEYELDDYDWREVAEVYGMSMEELNDLPFSGKIDVLVGSHGYSWADGDPVSMNKQELAAFLEINLD